MTRYTDYYEPVDKMKLFFEDEVKVNDFITIHQPTIQDIIDYPEDENGFYAMLHIFCGNTTQFRVQLWDMGIDWNKIDDFELFSTMIRTLDVEHTKILFGDLDFQKFTLATWESEGEDGEIKSEPVLYDSENEYIMTEMDYFRTRNYLRHMFNIFPKVETGVTSKIVKESIIDYDKQLIAKNKRMNKSNLTLFPMISTLLNMPGFKYNRETLRDVGIVEFMDSVQRITVIEHSLALLRGMYSGFINGKEIKPDQYDFMKDIDNKPKDYREKLKETAKNSCQNNMVNSSMEMPKTDMNRAQQFIDNLNKNKMKG